MNRAEVTTSRLGIFSELLLFFWRNNGGRLGVNGRRLVITDSGQIVIE